MMAWEVFMPDTSKHAAQKVAKWWAKFDNTHKYKVQRQGKTIYWDVLRKTKK